MSSKIVIKMMEQADWYKPAKIVSVSVEYLSNSNAWLRICASSVSEPVVFRTVISTKTEKK